MKTSFLFFAVLLLVLGVLGPAHAQQGRAEELAPQVAAQPRNTALAAEYGRVLLRAGRFREAEQQLRRVARTQRRSAAALFDIARVAFARGDYRASKAACVPVERLGRNAPIARVCRARTFLVWNRSARAFEELEGVLEQEPTNEEALLALGDANALRANVDAAIDAYRRAAAANATSAVAHLGLARVLTAAGRRPEALDALRVAYQRDPGWPEVQFELGRALGNNAEGASLLARAVAGRPNWPGALVALGDAQVLANDAAGALDHFLAAIRLSPAFEAAYRGAGRALLLLNRFEEAERQLRKALELVPNSAPSALALADVLSTAGRQEEALEQYRAAADLDPNDTVALLRASRLALTLGRDVLSAAFLDRLLDGHADLAAALALYGDIMRARGDRRSAQQYYQRALAGSGELDRTALTASMRALEALPDNRAQGRTGR